MKRLILFRSLMIFLGAQSSFADSSVENNFPEFSNVKNVGRLLAFPTIKEKLWFTPTAFSSTFECIGGELKKTCFLKVYNSVSQNEIAELRGLVQSPQQQLLTFMSFEDFLVKDIQEKFNLDDTFKGNGMSMNTLALSEKNHYGMAIVRVDAQTASELEEKYQNEGLGSFDYSFHLMGDWTDDYVYVQDPSLLFSELTSLKGKTFYLREVTKRLKEAVAISDIRFQNVSQAEARQVVYRYVLKNLLVKAGYGKYSVAENALEKVKTKLVILDETQRFSSFCSGHLFLKKGAISNLECNPEEK